MLNGVRALDLTDEKGFLCGKILGDLGVDVIKIEPPAGDPSRNKYAYWKDIADPEKSLYWFAYNSNKRGITLNLESADGRELFKKLVKTADFVIESFSPGYLDRLGLGYTTLSGLKKGIILTSITPFGQKGPYRDYKDSDLIIMAMSGVLYQTGNADGPPVQMSIPQACLHAGADAAAGTMVAYYHREQTGEGQQVDVSMQQSTGWFLANAIPTFELTGKVLRRAGALRAGTSRDVGQRQVWKCQDGYIFFVIIGGRTGAKTLSALVEWMDAENMATDFLKSLDWDNFDMFSVTRDVMEQISTPIGKFFLTHTSREILAGAVERHVSMGPLLSMDDLLNDRQLKARNFWVDIEHPELGTKITYPREFAKSTEQSLATRHRAPLIGEHNEEVYKEIGLSKNDLVTYKQAGII